MKKFLIFICLFIPLSVRSADIIQGGLKYDAESARKAAFQNINYKIPKDIVVKKLFDKDIEEHKNALKYKLFLPDRTVKLYELPFSKTYGVKFRNEPDNTYFYWFSNGYLKSVAVESHTAKNKFPVTIYRYNPAGELKAVSFQVSPDEEYIYNRDGSLNVHWIGTSAYDGNGKKMGGAQEILKEEL